MFTGIIQEIGRVQESVYQIGGKIISIECSACLQNLKIGDSISVNGACQTVIKQTDNSFSVYTSTETLSRTNLALLQTQNFVNLERPISINTLLDGHLVQGHIDGIGTITDITKTASELGIKIAADDKILRYMVDKASIAIEGISLTINEVSKEGFALSIIPLSIEQTTLRYKKVKDIVNIEVDIIAKYVEKFMDNGSKIKDNLSMDFLEKHGFV